MNIILRHTIRSIGSNKMQSVLIFITIVVVTLMMFSAFSMTDLFYNINVAENERMAGDSDVLVGGRTGGETFARAVVESVVRDTEDVVRADYFLKGQTFLRSAFNNHPVLVEATDIADFATPENGFFPIRQMSGGEYPPALVSERFLSEYGVNAGDVIELLSPISNRYIKFSITHVLEARGFFGSAVTNQIVVDLSAVDSMGLVNSVYLTLSNPSAFSAVEAKLKEVLPTVNIEEALNLENARAIAANNTMLLSVAVVFITVIMMLILFSCYLIIAKSRMNEMVLFKAAGASPGQTVLIMMAEVLFYGILGSVVGILLGRIIMEWVSISLIPYARNALSYESWKFFVSFLLGVGVSVLSALPPVMSVAKKSVRELTSSGVKHVKRGNPWISAGLSLVLAGFIVALFTVPESAVMWVLFAALPFLILWLSSVLKHVVRLLSVGLRAAVSSGGGALAAKTAGRSSAVLSVSTLVAVVIAFSFMITSVIDIVVIAVTPYNSRFNADIVLTQQSDTGFLAREEARKKFEDISGVNTSQSFGSIDLDIRTLNGQLIHSMTTISVSDEEGLLFVSDNCSKEVIDAFRLAPRPIVLNYDMKARAGLEVGDTVRFSRDTVTSSVTRTDYIDGVFTVVGFEYTATEWDRVGITKMGALTVDGKELKMSGGIFLTTENDNVFSAVRQAAEADGKFLCLRYLDWYSASSKGLEGVSTLMTFAQLLFSLIAILGVFNVSLVTFLDRRRELATYRLVGMSEKDYFKFHMSEGGIAALSGMLVGFVTAIFINRMMPVIASLVSKNMFISLFPTMLWILPIASGAVFLLIWLSLATGLKKQFMKEDYRTDRSLVA